MNAPLIRRELTRTPTGGSMQIVITPELLEYIRYKLAKGFKIFRIAKELEIRPETLSRIMERNGIEKPSMRHELITHENNGRGSNKIIESQELLDFMREKMADGMPKSRLAEILGISGITVSAIMKRNDIKPRVKPSDSFVRKEGVPEIVKGISDTGARNAIMMTSKLREYIIKRLCNMDTLKAISDDLGIPSTTLRRLIDRNNLAPEVYQLSPKRKKKSRDIFEEARIKAIEKKPKQEKVKLIVKPYDPAHMRPPSNAPKSVISFSKPKKTAKNEGITARQIEAGRSFARGMQKPN